MNLPLLIAKYLLNCPWPSPFISVELIGDGGNINA
ncbi:hypothetical protein SLEP1_g33764 [Rubroshorea leprosula]|uniref:Uncharacterized protein n=1 Tax=Rubroshorea leprosula TaxID=152421 RepID=A0AAV5KHN1_9ROSI|nr:hypothetical protein SLEP1_g33764 [Rubroshorea leprosula]